MKFARIVFLIGTLLFILNGCFGLFGSDEEAPAPTAPQERTAADEEQPPSQAPSFQDGDLYLQALRSRDASQCSSIVNDLLRERCVSELIGS